MTPETEGTPKAPVANLPGLDLARLDRYERISRLAHRLFYTPVVSLIVNDDERTDGFAIGAAGGATADRQPGALWTQMLDSPNVLVVRDTLRDARFAFDPLVSGPAGLRFLVSHPLASTAGERLGTLVLGDRMPRSLGADDIDGLADLAATVAAELDMTRHATTDALTSLLNRCGFMRMGDIALQLCKRQVGTVSLLYFDLNGFKQINDTHGHQEGDQALVQFSRLLRRCARSSDLVARLGGDEFVILAHSSGSHQPNPLLMRLRSAVDAYNRDSGKPYKICYSVGCANRAGGGQQRLDALLSDADRQMYVHKVADREATAGPVMTDHAMRWVGD